MAYESKAPEALQVDGFRVKSAAEGGELPEEVQRGLQGLVDAVAPVLEKPTGVVGMRFGRRVVVAPVDDPENAVDVCDVDVGRRIALTVGGREPGPAGLLLAQVLFLRSDAVVGYARATDTPGPTMEVLEQVLVPLQSGPAAASGQVGPVALGKLPSDVAGALGTLEQDGDDEGKEPNQA